MNHNTVQIIKSFKIMSKQELRLSGLDKHRMQEMTFKKNK